MSRSTEYPGTPPTGAGNTGAENTGAGNPPPQLRPADVPGPAPSGPTPHPAGARSDEPAIQVDQLTRSFGSVHAVQSLSMQVPRGAVTALVGPNGCGKSTLMLMLVALLAPDHGEIRVLGTDPAREPAAVRALVGWMPDQFGAWDSLTVREVLAVVGEAYFLPRGVIRDRVPELLEKLDLVPLADQPAHVLSRGQKQRLGLARALMPQPEVLILDEPASGLDPAARRRLLGIVRGFAADGGSVLVSSHILSELEEMADHVVFMDQGRVTDQASVRSLASRARPWRIQSIDEGRLRAACEQLGVPVRSAESASRTASGHAEAVVTLPDEATAVRLLADLTRADAGVIGFGPAAGRLESAYLQSDAARRQGAL